MEEASYQPGPISDLEADIATMEDIQNNLMAFEVVIDMMLNGEHDEV